MQQSCLLLEQCWGLWKGNWHLYYFQDRRGISQPVSSCTSSLLREWYPGLVASEAALGGSMRNLMWEYSRTWWLEALSQTYSMWWFESLISLLSLVMILWCISPVIQAFFEAYQATDMSFTCILYFFCKQWGVLHLPMTDSSLWSEPSMLVIISSVSLSLHFAEPAGLSPSKQ